MTEVLDSENLVHEELHELALQSKEQLDSLILKLIDIIEDFSSTPYVPFRFYPYQREISYRIIESIITGDGATITALQSRQSGKSTVVAHTLAVCCVMLPILARVFPDRLKKFERGFWLGCFGPTDDMAEIVYSKIVSLITSERAQEFYADPDIDIKVTKGFGNTINFSNGSLIRRQTAHPRSKIEGRTYHFMLMDEAQEIEESVISKSIGPMGAATNASKMMIGTASFTKGAFFKQIALNKKNFAEKRGAKKNHFHIDWKEVAKYNPDYKKYIQSEIDRIGEDSIEFQLSYLCVWMTDKGMFISSSRIAELGDRSEFGKIEQAWHKTPVVVGIDPARKQDSTIVTVMFVDWDHPDEYQRYNLRILNWLDLSGMDWEDQYFRITDFLSNYNVLAAGIDTGGLGDVVLDRLRRLNPRIHWMEFESDRATQSKRWKNLKELLERGKISWPAHAETRRLRVFKRFEVQAENLEIKFDGPYVTAAAPKGSDSHDDYMDSMCIAAMIPQEFSEEMGMGTEGQVSGPLWSRVKTVPLSV